MMQTPFAIMVSKLGYTLTRTQNKEGKIAMTVYSGVVKDNVIVLSEGVQLEEGTEVEVRTLPNASNDQISGHAPEAAEEAFKQRLLEKGLLTEIRRPSRVPPKGDRTPIVIEGTLSQAIIEDRR